MRLEFATDLGYFHKSVYFCAPPKSGTSAIHSFWDYSSCWYIAYTTVSYPSVHWYNRYTRTHIMLENVKHDDSIHHQAQSPSPSPLLQKIRALDQKDLRPNYTPFVLGSINDEGASVALGGVVIGNAETSFVHFIWCHKNSKAVFTASFSNNKIEESSKPSTETQKSWTLYKHRIKLSA